MIQAIQFSKNRYNQEVKIYNLLPFFFFFFLSLFFLVAFLPLKGYLMVNEVL